MTPDELLKREPKPGVCVDCGREATVLDTPDPQCGRCYAVTHRVCALCRHDHPEGDCPNLDMPPFDGDQPLTDEDQRDLDAMLDDREMEEPNDDEGSD